MSHYHHLTTNERESILRMLGEGCSLRKIAKALQRAASTISRELSRNKKKKTDYSPRSAEQRYNRCRRRCHKKTVLSEEKSADLVRKLFLEDQWSPEQIENRLALEKNEVQIGYQTVYRGIYSGELETEKLSHGQRGMARKLRHRGKTRHTKGKEETRGKIKISHPIEERPEEANQRTVIGHWEADTVAGITGSSCLITLTDRCSRFLLMKKIPKKTAVCVRDGIIEMLQSLPAGRALSVTPDRGKEFSYHEQVTEAMKGMPFYFPKPHAPWERGTNENTNGLIREYSPKSYDMNNLDDDYFQRVADKLNRRPRKCLGWRTPYEVFYGEVLHLT